MRPIGYKVDKHPLNLALRFILELIVLIASAYWAWKSINNGLALVITITLPTSLATIWGVFNVKNDPSRSGKTVVPVRGFIRLIIELLTFALGTWFLNQSGLVIISWIFSTVVILHYFASLERIKWLLQK